MKTIRGCHLVALLLSSAAIPAHAGPCASAIDRLQAKVDAAIEQKAGVDGWKRESLNALRGHQPTPRSLARSEKSDGATYERALNGLDRARAADRASDLATCRHQIARVKAALRQ